MSQGWIFRCWRQTDLSIFIKFPRGYWNHDELRVNSFSVYDYWFRHFPTNVIIRLGKLETYKRFQQNLDLFKIHQITELYCKEENFFPVFSGKRTYIR